MIKVKADGTGSYDIAAADAKYDKGKNIFKMNSTAVGTPFPADVIDYLEKLEITWQTMREGEEWKNAGTSTNEQVYITLETPSKKFHSIVDFATKNLNGKQRSSKREIVDAIWNKFRNRRLFRLDGALLSYWKSFCQFRANDADVPRSCFTPDSLIKEGDGRCGGWQDLFIVILKTQGIKSREFNVIPIPRLNFYGGIIVTSTNPAQGNDRPHFSFTDHALVKIEDGINLLYYPSYGGEPLADLLAWENQSLDKVTYSRNREGTDIVDEKRNTLDRLETQELTLTP